MHSSQRILFTGTCILIAGAIAAIFQTNHSFDAADDAMSLCAVIGLGIGGSLIASALVARLVANQVFGLDIRDALEALRGASTLTRANQSLEITLRHVGEKVHVVAQHRFDLQKATKYARRLPFSLYTDAARWGSDGGFYSIVEPEGTVLKEDDLETYISEDEGKIQFTKTYSFDPGKPSHFEVETFGNFRRSDRLIWTVEHISSDLSVKISDCRGEGKASVKVNHHRRSEIIDDLRERPSKEGSVIEFTFLGEILPFQGFELQWNAD